MAEPKTQKTSASVQGYIARLDEKRQGDCQILFEIMSSITKDEGTMWGTEIVGFGSYQYAYESGRTGEWFLTGFSSRKQAISLYMMAGFEGRDELLEQLGKIKHGNSCLYIKSIDDIHIPTLKKLIRGSVKALKKANA